MSSKVTMVRTKAWSWMKRGNKAVRITKVLAIAFLLYWLIHFLSTAFKIAEAFVSIGVYIAFIAWMKYQRELHLRLAGMDEIDAMEGTEFEQRMLVHFQDLGWKVESTPPSGDFGADLVLKHATGSKVVVQCKCYGLEQTVGVDAVQQAVAAVAYYKADSAMVITNRTLTKPAIQLAKANDVQVWERPQLAKSLASVTDWSPSLWVQVKSMLAYTFRRGS